MRSAYGAVKYNSLGMSEATAKQAQCSWEMQQSKQWDGRWVVGGPTGVGTVVPAGKGDARPEYTPGRLVCKV